MLGQYLPVLGLLVLAGVFAGVSFLMSSLLAPNRKTQAKEAPYECGIVPSREPPERFPVKFFLVAMSFIVFDIEIVFLYPWATIYRNLGAFGLVAIIVFSVPIIVALMYEFSKGALDWGPADRSKRLVGIVDARRTTSSTIRRVGLDGREFDPEPSSTEAA